MTYQFRLDSAGDLRIARHIIPAVDLLNRSADALTGIFVNSIVENRTA